eukprot:4177575-Lingulodinium_polyedra.AAC.1
MCVRLHLTAKYPDECGEIKNLWDDIICAAYGNIKRSNMPPKQFFQLYGGVCKLFFKPEDMEAVLNEKGAWQRVKDPLRRI